MKIVRSLLETDLMLAGIIQLETQRQTANPRGVWPGVRTLSHSREIPRQMQLLSAHSALSYLARVKFIIKWSTENSVLA